MEKYTVHINWKTQYSKKIPIFPKSIYKLTAIPIKITARSFVGIDKIILKFIRKCEETRIAKIIVKKKNKVGEINLHNFKT